MTGQKFIVGVSIVIALLMLAIYATQVRSTHELTVSFEVSGTGSNYPCTAGWCNGEATVALPLALGGRYNGTVHGYVEVCATRCATLAVVDYCQCYWDSPEQRVVDLNHAAWQLVTDAPLSEGLIEVTVRSTDSGVGNGGSSPTPIREGASSNTLPNTAVPSGR